MAPLTQQRSPRALVRRQHGVITHEQLVAFGYSAEAIKHRIRRGWLFPIHRGVYALGRRELSQEGLWMAAVLACGDHAALSHDTAAVLWGMVKRTKKIHVSVTGASRSRPGIECHRRAALATTTFKGIPVATPAQTLIDLAHVWDQTALEQAIGEADLRGRIGLEHLRGAAAQAGRRGAPLRCVIDSVTFRVTQSELEREFLRLLLQARLPLPETQKRFGAHRVDFWWPQVGLVVETDGGAFHRTARQQEADRRRDQAHVRAGRTPLRLTHGQVFKDRAATAALLVDVVERLGEDHHRASAAHGAPRAGARAAA